VGGLAIKPSMIGIKCAIGRGARGPLMHHSLGLIGHERYVARGVRRS
jgi:hypothetical protein